MKLSEYIQNLQNFMEEHGDMDCYYAIDDEGNGYQSVNYAGSLFLSVGEPEGWRPDLYGAAERDYLIEEEYVDDPSQLVEVCVVN